MSETTFIVDFGSEFVKYGDSTRDEPLTIRNFVSKQHSPYDTYSKYRQLNNCFNYDDFEEICVQLKDNNEGSNTKWMLPLRECYPFSCRERITQILIETLNIPQLCFPYSSPLPLYSLGLKTGVVVDAGGYLTEVNGICDGYTIHSAYRTFGGKDITKYLQKSSYENQFIKDTPAIYEEYFRKVKDKCAFVPLDFSEEAQKHAQATLSKRFQFPDGRIIELNTEQFRMGELLFNNDIQLTGEWEDHNNLSVMIYNCIQSASRSSQAKLLSNICLAGGTSNIPGLAERIIQDFKKQYNTPIRILSPPSKEFSIWKGAKELLNMPEYGGKFFY